jgi:hypothetical protein
MSRREIASSMSAVVMAAKSFEETLERLQLPQDAPELRDPVALGRRAALRAVAETAWGQVLGLLYDVEQTKTVLGVTSRQAVHDLAKRKRLLVLGASGGRKVYPAFQFDTTGRPYPEIPGILRAFEGAVQTSHTIASWFVTPQDVLEGETPASWIRARRDPDSLFESARRAAARLAQ